MRVLAAFIVTMPILGACGAHDDGAIGRDGAVRLGFVADAPAVGEEVLTCTAFDATVLRTDVGRIEVVVPTVGPVVVHHVALLASVETLPSGELTCDGLVEASDSLYVWTHGTQALELPDDVSLALPAGTRAFVVQVHAARIDSGAAAPGEVLLHPREPRSQRAAWWSVPAPVPAIRPHHTEASRGECLVGRQVTVLAAKPHMHRIGTEFHGAVLRPDGSRTAVVDVAPWDFAHQTMYFIDVTVEPGNVIETACTWRNDSDLYVLPGPDTNDEMCSQSLVAWPIDAAACEP